MFRTVDPKEGGPTAHTLSFTPPTPADELSQHVREHVRRLRVILPVISVAVMSLRHQDAELDHDIATVLSQHACEPLDSEIEHLESVLASLTCRHRWKGVRE
jgi:hypothetical protein